MFQDRRLEGAPRPLTELGLPPQEQVDAVFSWPLNGKTYLVRGQRYWRYDEAAASPDPGYPRDLSLWEGAPHAPDDVTVSNTGASARACAGPGRSGLRGAGARGGARAGGWQAWTRPRQRLLPPRRRHLLLQGRPLLALPQGQRQGGAGLAAAHGSQVAGLPRPQRRAPRPQAPQSHPSAWGLRLSVRDQSGAGAAVRAPPAAPSPPAGGGHRLRLTGDPALRGRGGIAPRGPWRPAAVGTSGPGAELHQTELGAGMALRPEAPEGVDQGLALGLNAPCEPAPSLSPGSQPGLCPGWDAAGLLFREYPALPRVQPSDSL